VELMNESITKAYQEDGDLRWIARFMERVKQEDPKLASALVQAIDKKAKELNVKTI
jgi:hypothetical protein